jgi:hypothetical protein
VSINIDSEYCMGGACNVGNIIMGRPVPSVVDS